MAFKGKHRCKCFSKESSSFLYGLRREAPSTERVLLERLLNILSRAAAIKPKSGNPQRLWSETERPEWWKDVTSLEWKNPREHPKDNKDKLKQRIEVLKKELPKRNLMTDALKKEIELHKEGKKVDLEMKSDFEAVIAKASGLHFMLDKVKTKMGQSKVISDKVATYIKETKQCLDKCHDIVSGFHRKVEQGERRKNDLWEQMGLSKKQRSAGSTDQALSDGEDCLYIDLEEDGLDEEDCLYIDLEEDGLDHSLSLGATSPVTVTSPTLSPPVASPYSPQQVMSDSEVVELIHSSQPAPYQVQTVGMLPQHQLQTQMRSVAPQIEVYTFPSGSGQIPFQRSHSQPTPQHHHVDTSVQVMDLSQGTSVAVSDIEPSPQPVRKSRRVSEEEEDGDPYRDVMARSPRQRSFRPGEVIEIEDEDDVVVHFQGQQSHVVSKPPEGDISKRKAHRGKQSREMRHTAYPDRSKSLGGHKRVHSASLVDVLKSRTFPHSSHEASALPQFGDQWSLRSVGGQGARPRSEVAQRVPVSTWRSSSTMTSTSKVRSGFETLASHDLVEDGEEELSVQSHSLDEVEDILEESTGSPTVTMYTGHDTQTGMDQLADMTKTLSCDDLRPSVTEPFMQGSFHGAGHQQHRHQQQQHVLLSDLGFIRGGGQFSGTVRSAGVASGLANVAGQNIHQTAPVLRRDQSGQLVSAPLLGQLGQGQGHLFTQQISGAAVAPSPQAFRQEEGREESLSQAIADFGGHLGP